MTIINLVKVFVIGILLFLIGYFLFSINGPKNISRYIAWIGLILSGISFLGILYLKYLEKFFVKIYSERKILKYKEFYDKGILSKEEYESKLLELKPKILD